MQTTTALTINEINRVICDYTSTWDGVTRSYRFSVGRTGKSRLGTTGEKVHLLRVVEIIADESETNTYPVPRNNGVAGVCNGNGQWTGREISGKDIQHITCEKCLRKLESIIKAYEEKMQKAVAA